MSAGFGSVMDEARSFAYSSPSAICLAMGKVSSVGIGVPLGVSWGTLAGGASPAPTVHTALPSAPPQPW